MKSFDNIITTLFMILVGVVAGVVIAGPKTNQQLSLYQEQVQQLLSDNGALQRDIDLHKTQIESITTELQITRDQNRRLAIQNDSLLDSISQKNAEAKLLSLDLRKLEVDNQALLDSLEVMNEKLLSAVHRAEYAEQKREEVENKKTLKNISITGNSLLYALLLIVFFNLLPRSIRKLFEPTDSFV